MKNLLIVMMMMFIGCSQLVAYNQPLNVLITGNIPNPAVTAEMNGNKVTTPTKFTVPYSASSIPITLNVGNVTISAIITSSNIVNMDIKTMDVTVDSNKVYHFDWGTKLPGYTGTGKCNTDNMKFTISISFPVENNPSTLTINAVLAE